MLSAGSGPPSSATRGRVEPRRVRRAAATGTLQLRRAARPGWRGRRGARASQASSRRRCAARSRPGRCRRAAADRARRMGVRSQQRSGAAIAQRGLACTLARGARERRYSPAEGWRWTVPSPTRSGPEGSSRNEFRAGSPSSLPPRLPDQHPGRWSPAAAPRRLPGPRPRLPPDPALGADRPGGAGPHAQERVRLGPRRPRLPALRHPRRRQDDDRPDHRPRPQLHRPRRQRRADARAVRRLPELRRGRRATARST